MWICCVDPKLSTLHSSLKTFWQACMFIWVVLANAFWLSCREGAIVYGCITPYVCRTHIVQFFPRLQTHSCQWFNLFPRFTIKQSLGGAYSVEVVPIVGSLHYANNFKFGRQHNEEEESEFRMAGKQQETSTCRTKGDRRCLTLFLSTCGTLKCHPHLQMIQV
jgi:hypothetical protein